MKNTQINLNAMITRINNFGVAHAADFTATSKGGVLFASVAAGVPKVGSRRRATGFRRGSRQKRHRHQGRQLHLAA